MKEYFANLKSKEIDIKSKLEDLLAYFELQPVGNGFIDLILTKNVGTAFLKKLNEINVAADSVSLWCHVIPGSDKGCPHGGGGPVSSFTEGWYSELYQYPDFEINVKASSIEEFVNISNEKIDYFINHSIKQLSYYSSCFVPALWLKVPNNWVRQTYDI